MKSIHVKDIALGLIAAFAVTACGGTKQAQENSVFEVLKPDKEISPLTGMTRKHWIDAATYVLDGAFSYIDSLDAPMKFPKQGEVAYPRNDNQIPTEKLEGLCRTLFVAAPLLKENPELTLNNIKVADYYRHQLLNLINPNSPSFITHRAPDGGPHQNLVEFGALSISLFAAPEVLWEPLTTEQKDALAATMISYGDGPTVPSNWKFFNIFVLSFFKSQGYEVNEALLEKYLQESLAHYRGDGWYNDNPAYDYYSMWAFQMYGPLWAELFGKAHYPEYAHQFMDNLREMANNYPYMFNREGEMIMWGRSICYRFGSAVPLAMTGLLYDSSINYGWMRRIASSTLLQFLQNPDFMDQRVPSLGFYGSFDPAVQGYSCRGSVYWCGKAFLALLLPADNPFWTATENNGAWEHELTAGNVYNKFQAGSKILITDYPNSGASEIRAWCHVPYITSWEKFRASENYNKLAYNSEFPWMADGKAGEISMNYAILNKEEAWEVLRLYTFRSFEDGVYRRDAFLETNPDITFKLADIPLPNGILRVDKVSSPIETDIRLGNYSLPQLNDSIAVNEQETAFGRSIVMNNGVYQLATVPCSGWSDVEVVHPVGLHPVSKQCAVAMTSDRLPAGERVYITLHLWKKSNDTFTADELNPIDSITFATDGGGVEVILKNGEKKNVVW